MHDVYKYSVGSTVKILGGEVEGQVIAITIRAKAHITYEVVYWIAGVRYQVLLEEAECAPILPDNKPPQIGFQQEG